MAVFEGASGGIFTASPTTLNLPRTTQQGDFIVVAISFQPGASNVVLSGGGVVSPAQWWVFAGDYEFSGSGPYLSTYYAFNVNAGATTITLAMSGVCNGSVSIAMFSGVGSANPWISATSGSYSSANTVTTSSLTYEVGDLVIGSLSTKASPSSLAWSDGHSSTNAFFEQSNTYWSRLDYITEPSNGSTTLTYNWAANTSGGAGITVFRPTPPPPSPGPVGFWSGASPTQGRIDAAQYLGISSGPPTQLTFLGGFQVSSTQSWANVMANPYYVEICANAGRCVLSIPMVVGYSGSGGTGLGWSPQGPADTLGTGTAATLTISASSGSGYSFSYNGGAASTSTFPYNATAAQITSALNSTAGISGATATLSPNLGTGSNTFLITFPLASAITPSLLTTTVGGNLLTTGATMHLGDVGAGIWNTLFTLTFQAAVNGRNPAVYPTVLRMGWEMYGSAGFGYPWCTAAQSANHKAAWITLWGLAKAVSSSFLFDWNGGIAYGGYDPMTAGTYPGDQYVDYISCDVYDNNGGLFGQAGWNAFAPQLAEGVAFAKAHGKPFCIPELGLWASNNYGGGDDPAWLEAAYYWLRANISSNGYVMYFNDNNQLGPGGYVNGATIIQSLFGAWAREAIGQTGYRFLTAGTNRYRAT